MIHASTSRERPSVNKNHYNTLSSQQNMQTSSSYNMAQGAMTAVTPPSAQAVRKTNASSANQMAGMQKQSTRQTPNVQRKVNNLLRNIETSARLSKQAPPTSGMTSTRKHLGNSTTNIASQASTLREVRAAAAHDVDSASHSKQGAGTTRQSQKKQTTQASRARGQMNTASYATHGAQTARAGLKTMLSPQRPSARNAKPPQQNTRIKFHKPELDLFSKKSGMSRGVASPITDGAMSDMNSQSPKPVRVNSQAAKGYVLSPQTQQEVPMTASPPLSHQRAATSNQMASGTRKTGLPDNFSFVDRKYQQYVQGSFSPPPPVLSGGTIGSARATMGQRGSGTGSGRGVSGGDTWRQQRALPNDAGGSASGYFSYNPTGAEAAKNTQSAANLKLSAMAGYGSGRPPAHAQYPSTQSAAYLDDRRSKDRNERKVRGSTSRTRGSPLAQVERPSPSAAALSPSSVSKTNAGYQPQAQRTRIQKAPVTANVLPQTRLVQQQSKIISQNVQNITAALSKTSQDKARASKKSDNLLNTGMNRRIEGIAGGGYAIPQNRAADPFDFQMGNVKDDDEQMNLNSVEEGRLMRISSTALQKQHEAREMMNDYNSPLPYGGAPISSRSGSNFAANAAGASSVERAAHTAQQSRLHHFQAQADKNKAGYSSMAARQQQMNMAQRRDRSARINQRTASKVASRTGQGVTHSNIEDPSYAMSNSHNMDPNGVVRTGNETTQLMSLGEDAAYASLPADEPVGGQPTSRHDVMSEEFGRQMQPRSEDEFGDYPREEQVDELVVEDLFQKKKIMSASVASIAGMSHLGLQPTVQPGGGTRRRQVGLSPSTVTVEQDDGYGTQRAPILITNDNNFKKKFAQGIGAQDARHGAHLHASTKSMQGAKVNYIARNIKRVGLTSKEKHTAVLKTHRGDLRSTTNFDGTGMANAADQPGTAIASPRTHRGEIQKHLVGSMASLGSPSSPGIHAHGAASKKNQRKYRMNKDKEAQNSHSSNLFGQTGTTGGTAPFHAGRGTGGAGHVLSPQPHSRQHPVVKSYRDATTERSNQLTDKYISVLARQGAAQASGNEPQRKQPLQTALSKSTQNFHAMAHQGPQGVDKRARKPQYQASGMLQDRIIVETRYQTSRDMGNKMNVATSARRAAQKSGGAVAGGPLNTVRLNENIKTPILTSDPPTAVSNSASKKSAGGTQASSMKATVASSQKLAAQRHPVSASLNVAVPKKKVPPPQKIAQREKSSKIRQQAPPAASMQNFMSQPSASSKAMKLSSHSATPTDGAREAPLSVTNGDGSSLPGKPAPDAILVDEPGDRSRYSGSGRLPQTYTSSSREDFKSQEPAPRTGSPGLLPQSLDGVNSIASPPHTRASAQVKGGARPRAADKSAPANRRAQGPQATEQKKNQLRNALNDKGYAPDLVVANSPSPAKKKTPVEPKQAAKQKRTRNADAIAIGVQQDARFNDDRNFLNSSRYLDELEHSRAASRQGQTPARLDDSMITTQSEVERYEQFAQNVTAQGMVQSTIYHIRHEGQNVYDPYEKSKYYSDEFLMYQRHVNEKVEQELEEFKIEIDEKVAENTSKFYVFPRPCGRMIYTNTEGNCISDNTGPHRTGVADDTEDDEAQPLEPGSAHQDSDAYLTPRNAKVAANDYGNQSLTDLLGDDGRGVLAGGGPGHQVKAAARAAKASADRNRNQMQQQMPSSTGRRAVQAAAGGRAQSGVVSGEEDPVISLGSDAGHMAPRNRGNGPPSDQLGSQQMTDGDVDDTKIMMK